MKRFCATLLMLLVSISAHSQSLPERTGLNSLLGISPSTDDFVREVVLGQLFKMELNKAAQTKGSASTNSLAAAMLKEQQTSEHIRALVQSGKVRASYPTALDSERAVQFARLQLLSGAEFDAEFLKLQNELHEKAVSLFERYGNRGEHPDLKIFAHRHLPQLQEHWRQVWDLSKQANRPE